MIEGQTKRDRILIVDDTPDNLLLLQTMLEDEPYDLLFAENGMSTLAYVDRTPLDLILLDVMMPGMDGYEVTRRIRHNPKLPYIPILLITAHDHSNVAEGLDAGADDFVHKPVEPDELMARVRSLLRLKHSIDEREAMAQLREDFISRLTHDLRTPLVAADRMLQLLRQGAFSEVPPSMDEALGLMMRNNQNLLQMVNTILEVHRHEAGQKSLTFYPCDLAELAHEVIDELHPLAAEKNLQLKLDLPDNQPSGYTILGDRLELRRLLTNLVGNAVKFTDDGRVTLRLRQVNAPPSESWVDSLAHSSGKPPSKLPARSQPRIVLEVEDTGVGIAPEERKTLFERFRKGKHKRSDSGLGLYLSRRIVEAHQGTIEVDSELGQGSRFTVELPASVPVSV